MEHSRVNHLDEEAGNMIGEMKRDAARHRWRRSRLATQFTLRVNEGKLPSFENHYPFPGLEGTMVEDAKSPPKSKYFQEGTVLNTLLESGVEVVWFGDMTQNDVVYGICVHRKERKVTVVFRGTVRLIV
jgi:hypothetical protein